MMVLSALMIWMLPSLTQIEHIVRSSSLSVQRRSHSRFGCLGLMCVSMIAKIRYLIKLLQSLMEQGVDMSPGWRKSTASGDNSHCVKVRFDGQDVLLGDTKNHHLGAAEPVLRVPVTRWTEMLTAFPTLR
jgi:hypothetical protein